MAATSANGWRVNALRWMPASWSRSNASSSRAPAARRSRIELLRQLARVAEHDDVVVVVRAGARSSNASTVAGMPQIGAKSRVTCFCSAAVACMRLRVETSLVSETSAMWSVSGKGAPLRRDAVLTGRAAERLRRWTAMLEQSQVAHYLLSLGLVKPRAVLEDGPRRRRRRRAATRVFVVTTRRGPTYVVKQAGPRAPARSRTRRRSCACSPAPALAGHVPARRAPRPRRGRGSSCARRAARATGASTTAPARSRAPGSRPRAALGGAAPAAGDGSRAAARRRPHVGARAPGAAARAACST